MTIMIERETPDQPEVRGFFAASEAYMAELYPAESNHFIDVAALLRPDVVFLVARLNAAAVGCGAVVPAADGTGEIKRMWVDPGCRGQRLGAKILNALVAAGRAAGLTALQLETGISQPEALGLYRKAGFVDRGSFGGYVADPLSVFMQLDLDR